MSKQCFKSQFLIFPHLEKYIKDCKWENKAPELENRMKTILLDHLQLVSENFKKYFPQNFIKIWKMICE